jgi:hypothetical protein
MLAKALSSLRILLLVDAATCAAMGLLLTLAVAPLAAMTAIPAALLFGAGVVLFPVAAFMALVAARAPVSRPAARLIVAGNELWVVASLWLMFGGWIEPNGFGLVFIGVQAAAVTVIALLESAAARRLPIGAAGAAA